MFSVQKYKLIFPPTLLFSFQPRHRCAASICRRRKRRCVTAWRKPWRGWGSSTRRSLCSWRTGVAFTSADVLTAGQSPTWDIYNYNLFYCFLDVICVCNYMFHFVCQIEEFLPNRVGQSPPHIPGGGWQMPRVDGTAGQSTYTHKHTYILTSFLIKCCYCYSCRAYTVTSSCLLVL